MSLLDELRLICDLLAAGVLCHDRISALLRESIARNEAGDVSFHRSTGDNEQADLRDAIVVQLSSLRTTEARQSKSKANLATAAAEGLRAKLRILEDSRELASETDQEVYDRVLARFEELWPSRKSHGKLGEEMAREFSQAEWDAYRRVASAKAKVGESSLLYFKGLSARKAKDSKNSPQ